MSVSAEAIAFQTPIGLADPKANRYLTDLTSQLRRLHNLVQQRSTQSDLGKLAAAITAAQADLLAIHDAISGIDIDAISDQQAFIANLTAQVDGIIGDLSKFNDTAFDWTQKAAVGGINALVKGHINDGRGRTQIINEQLVRETETDALAQSVLAVNAEIALTNANVTAVQAAYATADSALASSITSVSTAVAGNTASITSLASSVDGIEARWGIAVNVQGQVVGVVQLDGSASGSTFSVVADKMQVAQPGVSGGDPIPVFVISTVGGAAKIALRGDMIADGSITVTKMSVASLSAISADFGTAVFSGVAKGTADKMIIDFNTPRLRMVAA